MEHSDVLLQCLRSILAAVYLLDNGPFVLTLDSRNNAPSEILPTWNLKKNLHDPCAKNSSKLHSFGMFVFLRSPTCDAQVNALQRCPLQMHFTLFTNTEFESKELKSKFSSFVPSLDSIGESMVKVSHSWEERIGTYEMFLSNFKKIMRAKQRK